MTGNQQARQSGRTSTKGDLFNEAHYSTRNDRWLTPLDIIAALGEFDLDPCAAPGHPTATTRWTPEEVGDGLSMPWFGRVWLNPPYGREQRPWMERLAHHGKGTALIPVATGTKLWQEVIFPHAAGIFWYRHRVTFLHPHAEKGGMVSPQASALVAFGGGDAAALQRSTLPGVYTPLPTETT